MTKVKFEIIKEVLKVSKSEIRINDFLNIHTLTEMYFRRLLYISLRLNKENDKDAKKMTSLCSLNSIEVLEKAVNLISQKKQNIEGEKFDFAKLKSTYNNFSVLFNYYNNFTSRHRNLYLHGISDEINENTLKLLYCIERKLLIEIERILKQEYGKSCLDTPTTCGAKRITEIKTTSIPIRMNNYRLGILGKSPIKNSSVRRGLKKNLLSC